MDHDHPESTFVLRPTGRTTSACWVVGPLRDPYGDGSTRTVVSELHDDGLSAAADAHIDGTLDDGRVVLLPAFVRTLADGWRGWEGVRTWRSLDDELLLDARHDGRGYVALGVTLRLYGPTVDETRWTARAVFHLEAGEELEGLATGLAHTLQLPA